MKDLVELRTQDIDGFSDWLWPKQDTEAWTGPQLEWLNTHREAYLAVANGRSTVVQAGGNCGMYPKLFTKYFSTVYTFEPDALNFYCLANNCSSEQIIKFNCALGDSNLPVQVHKHYQHNVGCHTVTSGGTIPQLTIDQLNLPACSLIQLDTEGFETNILRGAMNTIAKYRPGIACEQLGYDQITPLLQPLGYKLLGVVVKDYIYSCEL
jgi:FkbM family methyltransferase